MASPLYRFRLATLWLLIFVLGSSFSLAEEAQPATVETAETWLLSTRCAPLCGDLEVGKGRIRCWRSSRGCDWETADAETLYRDSADHRPTVFVIHGNRISSGEAVDFAWPVFRHLESHSEGRPFRLVIWSWPSDRISRRNRPDVQIKAAYCDSQSYYLADSVRRLDAATPLHLVGYSFGARIITGGLHLLAGGRLAGRQLPKNEEEPVARTVPLHGYLVAAALDCYCLSSGCRNGLALSQADSFWITCNGCDPVLRWYPRLYGRGGPQALGYVGPCCNGDTEKLKVVDVSCAVGRAHDWECYLYYSGLLPKLADATFSE
jgi:hypothetical protein